MQNFKSLLLATFFFFFAGNSFAQDDKKNIENAFKGYIQTLIDKEYVKAVEYIPEDFFEFVKKDQMIKVLEQTMNNPAFEAKISQVNSIEIQDLIKIKDKYYAIIRYQGPLSMKFSPEDKNETKAQLKARNNLTKLALQNSFGLDNVELDETSSWFHIKAKKNACAISEDGKSNWKFVVIEPKQRLILDRILPKEITSKI